MTRMQASTKIYLIQLAQEDPNRRKINLVKGTISNRSTPEWLLKLPTIILISTSLIMIRKVSQSKRVVTKQTIHNKHGAKAHKTKTFCNQETENNYQQMANQTAKRIQRTPR